MYPETNRDPDLSWATTASHRPDDKIYQIQYLFCLMMSKIFTPVICGFPNHLPLKNPTVHLMTPIDNIHKKNYK